ncbi:unnamed protein product [Effrenium voratum]|uniref:Cyclic nucleotide-binding domain-containing protein n=1 Tax=Effrenium voratum TaxID=2562239 RepID=A0AA36I751_9DINO|nr:unnamed protein product [Effrenium voratum]
MAARMVLQQILKNDQRRNRGSVRPQRISATGLALSLELGPEEEGFLHTLKSSVEARVPGLHGPAGTGGTGNMGEEDSDSQEETPARDGPDEAAMDARSFDSLSDQERLGDSPKRHCLILSPRDPWKICWDVFIGTLIIYTIITLTWRIGFDQEARGVALAFEYSVDVIFAVDTVLCFRTGFFVEDVLVTDWEKIAKRYCMTYFLFDLLSWFPIDLIVQVLTGQSSSGMRSVKLMKFVRLVRLAKLIRLFKLNRFLVIMEEKLHLKPAVIRMVRLIINIVFLAHLLACMWHFIALPACGVESEEVSAIGPCPEGLEPDRPNWIRDYNVDKFSLVSKYIASFHFITATMMAVGYGDIWAKNTEERLFCIMLQLFGATAFGFILSSVTCLLESANPRANETNKRVNEIKEWCAGRRIPRYLRMAIREHTQYVLQKKSIFNEADILANMPMSIRMDVIQNSYAEWLRVLERPFHEEDLALRTELAQLMMPQQVLQNEMMIEEGEITSEVYVVQHGCLEMVTSEYTADLPSINWVSACLKRSALGDTADTEDDTSEESDQAREVLCGLCRSSDVVGQVVAAPIMVRGLSSRTDVLAISKDCLVDVLLRFPGAVARSEAAEERAKAEMTKVLESELKYNPYGERECKSLVLLRGVASGAAELPPVVLNADRTQPIPLALLRVASPDPTEERTAEPGMRKARPSIELPSPPLTPSTSARHSKRLSHFKSLTSFTSTGTKSSRNSSYPILLSTRRLGPSGQIEMTEETEDCLLQRYIIPPSYRWKLRWDILVGALIIYSVLIIPWRISFDIDPDPLATVFEILVDIIFAIDVVLCFRSAFADADGTIDTVFWHISRRYLRTWFTFDLLSTVPVDRFVEAITGQGGPQARALKMIRMVRLIRLLKLARVLKMGKLVQRIEDILDLSPLTLRCINLGTKLTVMSHFMGCFWFFVSTHQDMHVTQCVAGLLDCDPNENSTNWWAEVNIKEGQKWDQYIASLYWAFTTMTTVGYGDIHPRNDGERVYAIVAMIFGATMFGYIIGSIAAMAGQERGIEALTKKKLSLVRHFCEEQRVSENKVREVMRHYAFFYEERSPFNENALMMELPNWLRKKVSKHIHREALARLGVFAGPQQKGLEGGPLPDWFTCWAMRILEPQAVCAGELVINAEENSLVQELFLVFDGECEAFCHRNMWRPAPPGGHSDTGGSADIPPDEATATNTGSSGGKVKTLMVFSPGCMFGLEHLAQQSQRHSVRCSKAGPCLLYVLRATTMAEVQVSSPEMVKALQKAIANLMVVQTKLRVPQKNLELRRQSAHR